MSSDDAPPPLPKEWASTWIVLGGHPEPNTYFHARRRFRLPWKPVRAVAWVTADSRYRLWVNGRPVCRGPARCFPETQAVDAVDITGLLRKGANAAALLVHQYGVSTFAYIHRQCGGFLFQAEIEGPRRERVIVDSNGWRVRRCTARDARAARTSVQTGYQEVFHGEFELEGWIRARFDDASWEERSGGPPVGTEPWLGLEARQIPFLREQLKRASTVCTWFRGGEGTEARDPSRVMENFAAEHRVPSRPGTTADPRRLLRAGGEGLRIGRVPPDDFCGFVVDFGAEVAGYPAFEVLGASGGEIIDLVYAERLDEQGLPLYPDAHPGWPLRMADRYICRAGDQDWETFAWRGFRYLTLVVRNVRRPIRIRNLHLTATGYPVEPGGAFRSSDRRLNRIWDVAARTLSLCMFDAYVDCPWREQAQWLGDAVVEGLTCFHVFGDSRLFRRTLRQASQARTHDGLLYGVYPSEAHGCVLPDYNLTWILGVDGYYTYTGDITLLIDTFDAAVGTLERHAEHAARGGLLGAFPGRWLFLDWAPLDRSGYSATYGLLYLLALKAMIRICTVLGRLSRRYVERFARVRRTLQEHFVDPETKLWHEALDPRTLERRAQLSQHAHALAALAGYPNEEVLAEVIFRADNADRDVVPATSYFYFFVHAAMARLGRTREMLDSIRRRWGAMLDDGATTFWEDFTRSGPGTSSCHAWSCGPAFHLSRSILGVRPSHPGWRRFAFRPFAGGLDSVEGRVPTPHGPIEIAWTRDGDNLDARITVPTGALGCVGPGSNRTGKNLRPGVHHVKFAADPPSPIV